LKVVIVGAGLTGLSTAYHLEKSGFFDFAIFEQNSTHGGLCRSVEHEGFTFDFTGHFLHCNDPYFQGLLSTLLPPKTRYEIERKSFVYTHNRYIPYPIQNNLGSLPPQVLTECLCGFAKRKHWIKNPKNFYEWALKHFGTGLAKHFFFPYNKKLFSISNTKEIHHSWTGRFVPKTTIHDIIETLVTKKIQSVGYNNCFIYPKRGGIQTFTDSLCRRLKTPIRTNHRAVSIDQKAKTITFDNGHVEPFETLITTIPLDTLLGIIKEPSNHNARVARKNLRCTTVVNFNLGFSPAQFDDKHWLYIPEKQYSFYRAGFWHNFSKHLARPGCGSLYGELSYLPGTKSEREVRKLTEQSITQLCTMLGLTNNQVVTQKLLHLPHAYVIYDEWRERNLSRLLEHLQDRSIHSIGRYGEWKYSSMQEAILDGKQIATNIVATQTQIIRNNKQKRLEK